jgi:hypothetical protein
MHKAVEKNPPSVAKKPAPKGQRDKNDQVAKTESRCCPPGCCG